MSARTLIIPSPAPHRGRRTWACCGQYRRDSAGTSGETGDPNEAVALWRRSSGGPLEAARQLSGSTGEQLRPIFIESAPQPAKSGLWQWANVRTNWRVRAPQRFGTQTTWLEWEAASEAAPPKNGRLPWGRGAFSEVNTPIGPTTARQIASVSRKSAMLAEFLVRECCPVAAAGRDCAPGQFIGLADLQKIRMHGPSKLRTPSWQAEHEPITSSVLQRRHHGAEPVLFGSIAQMIPRGFLLVTCPLGRCRAEWPF